MRCGWLLRFCSDMARIALKGFTEEYKSFIKGIIARENFHSKKKVLDNDVALIARMRDK